MFQLLAKLLSLSIVHRHLVLVLAACAAALGVYSFTRLPIDAVPDITNVQVQVNTPVDALPPEEVERLVTFPIESSMGGIPKVEEVRSISRYGLSQVTLVFEEGTDIYFARQLVNERLSEAKEGIPDGFGEPEMGPIATGLGEITMWTVEAEPGALRTDGQPYTLSDLRTLQDWVVRPQLRTVRGVNEINSIGGHRRLLQVAPDPFKLVGYGLGFDDVVQALRNNNANAGGGYIEPRSEQVLVRAAGLVSSADDVEEILVGEHNGTPIRIRDVADVVDGHELRTGAATENGEEVVIGTAIMLMGENSRTVSNRVVDRLEEVNKSLPEGVVAKTIYDRTYLVDATLRTVGTSLAEGAFLVVVVLLLLVGNVRAALIAALVIPMSMLIAVVGMVELGVSGNLMSLGAVDFGLIVDGAVIIVENCTRRFAEEQRTLGRSLSRSERLRLAYVASEEVLRPSIVGVLIIGVVYLPVLTLTGIEGKMFRPMAITVVLALTAASVLSMTVVPALVAVLLRGRVADREAILFRMSKSGYQRALQWTFERRGVTVGAAAAVLGVAALMATDLGSEFAPRLGEGALALQPARIPSTSLETSLEMQSRLERDLAAAFPDEIENVFARTGTAEIATDPMGPNVSDTYLMLKPRSEWTRAETQDELAEAMREVTDRHIGQSYEFSQPIELRFNELISGVRSEVAVKIFGDDLDVMRDRALEVATLMRSVPGATDVQVEQTTGLPVLTIQIDRRATSRYGIDVADVQTVVQAAVGGKKAGEVYDGDARFDLVVRLPDSIRRDVEALKNLPVPLPDARRLQSGFVPLSAVADVDVEEGPNQISRENAKRRVVVQCNVRGRDLGGFVDEARERIEREVDIPPTYWIEWGGQFENLTEARQRLTLIVPVALALIMAFLFLSLGSVKNAALIFTGVPLALSGGVAALWLRGLPFTISAGVGFIALSGVAVLNGLVMVTFIENLRRDGTPRDRAILQGSLTRLRPVLMTALVASLGFVPMALATGTGAEVQRPLATVVVGGIVSSTLLTLLVLPILYRWFHPEERVFEEPPDSQRPPPPAEPVP